MVQTRVVGGGLLGGWLLGALLACSAEPQTPAEGSFRTSEDDRQQDAELVVHVNGEAIPTGPALLTVHLHSDGSSLAELSFEAGTEDELTSVVLLPSVEELRAGDFQTPVTRGALTPGSANVIVGGQWMERGLIRITIEAGGAISGSTSGVEPELSFDGKAVLHCMVPASQSDGESVPAPSSDAAGEVLWLDSEFTTQACRDARDGIGRAE